MGGKKARILCVDDHMGLLEILRHTLKHALGVDVTLASTLKGAAKKLRKGNVDLVTLDLMMPIEDSEQERDFFGGLALLRDLRQGKYGAQNSDLPVVVLSAATRAELEVEILLSGSNTWCLSKGSVSDRDIVEIIKQALDLADA